MMTKEYEERTGSGSTDEPKMTLDQHLTELAMTKNKKMQKILADALPILEEHLEVIRFDKSRNLDDLAYVMGIREDIMKEIDKDPFKNIRF